MIARRAFARGALALFLGSTILLSGCEKGTFGETYDPVYLKLKAEVETPDGIKSGYSVFEITGSTAGSLWGSLASSGFSFKGEAVAVDLPNGKTLFVLLSREYQHDWAAYRVNDIKIEYDDGPKPANRAERQDVDRLRYDRLRASREVFPVSSMPMMVRFKDINDPLSVEEVDPDNLAASFGEGYALKSLTVQATDEPVTRGIKERFSWSELEDNPRFAVQDRDPDTGYLVPPKQPTIGHSINSSSFWRGFKK